MSRSRKRHSRQSFIKKKPNISYKLSQDITRDKSPEIKRNINKDVIYNMVYIDDEKFEYWVEYDEKCRPIYYYNSRGYEWKCKYNNKGNISDYWDNTGYQEQYKYYMNNIVICTTSFGNKIKKIIDRNRIITRDVFINS